MSFFFISYQREMSGFAEDLKEQMGQAGMLGWLDSAIPLGKDWKREIDTAIENSFGLILVVTSKSLASKYVTYEWAYAMGLGKEIIPLILESIKDDEWHPKLEAIQHLDFWGKREYEKLFVRLKEVKENIGFSDVISQAEEKLNTTHRQDEQKQMIYFLEQNDHPDALAALIRACDSTSKDIRIAASIALAHKTYSQDTRALSGLYLGLQNSYFRNEALDLIATFLSEENIEQLIEVFRQYIRDEISDLSRHELIKALFKTRQPQAIAAIEEAILINLREDDLFFVSELRPSLFGTHFLQKLASKLIKRKLQEGVIKGILEVIAKSENWKLIETLRNIHAEIGFKPELDRSIGRRSLSSMLLETIDRIDDIPF